MNYYIFNGTTINSKYDMTYLYNPTSRNIYILASHLRSLHLLGKGFDEYIKSIPVHPILGNEIYDVKAVSLESLAKISELIPDDKDIVLILVQVQLHEIIKKFAEMEHKDLCPTVDDTSLSIINNSVNTVARAISSEENVSHAEARGRIDQLFREQFCLSKREELAFTFFQLALKFILNIDGSQLVGNNYSCRKKSM